MVEIKTNNVIKEIHGFCPNWHPYSEENTYIDKNGYKHCRTCARDRMRAIRALNPGQGQGSYNKKKIQCPKGHYYTPENTYINPQGRRACKICARANAFVQKIKRYGITSEQWRDLLIQQNYSCYICKKKFEGDIDIDHDHSCCKTPSRTCGKCVRGLLCGECNRGLARFKENSDFLRRAADYIDNPPFTGYSITSTN